MDKQRERIQDDLRGVLDGEVRCDDLFTQMYACDGSIFELRPLAVVRPRTADDVSALISYAKENHLPIHPRGAGTSLVGQSLGAGVVLDFSHAMRRILEIGDDFARVQPGVVITQLNRQLAPLGRKFAPNPTTKDTSTIGSVLSVNRAGSHFLRHGSSSDHVERILATLGDGTAVRLERKGVKFSSDEQWPTNNTSDVNTRLAREVGQLIVDAGDNGKSTGPKCLINSAGYAVDRVLRDGTADLTQLFCGSEGTLAVMTEATVKTVPLPATRGTVLFLFDRLEKASDASLLLRRFEPACCDLMDRRLISIAREQDVRYELLLPSHSEALLLVEVEGDDSASVREKIDGMVSLVGKKKRLAFDSRIALDPQTVSLYWNLVSRVVPMLFRLKGTSRPIPLVEDLAVPPETLADFLPKLQNVLKRHGITSSLFAHAGHGEIQLRPFLDLGQPDDVVRLFQLAEELFELVIAEKGTISGEHGDGLARSWFLPRQYGARYRLFEQIKKRFDPQHILNPGKVVGGPGVDELMKLLRKVTPTSSGSTLSPASQSSKRAGGNLPVLMNWDVSAISHAARQCNGCGHCRTVGPDARMCPIFRFAPMEESSPRAKANLLRSLLTGQIDRDLWGSDEFRSISDLCVHCHQCRLECPAHVNIPQLMLEAKSQHVAHNGLTPGDWFLLRLDGFAAFGGRMQPLSGILIKNRVFRWALERFFGIARGRKLPAPAGRTFIRWARRRRLDRSTRRTGRKVFYFVDVYANRFDPDLGRALVSVMEHNGVAVYVHPLQRPSGMIPLTLGAVEVARRSAAKNLSLLAEAVRQGYDIVTTEPSAALCIRHEYPNLLDDPDTRAVSEHTFEACDYLWKMHQAGSFELDFNPVNATVGYHLPCHQRALQVGTPGENLLRLVPSLNTIRVEKGCSGMAGMFGLKRVNYRNSLRAGWDLISGLREPKIQVGTTECSTCKMQMEQGARKPTIHPIKLLALAYGLMPEVEPLLTKRGDDLVVT